jgi:hypothetical protein
MTISRLFPGLGIVFTSRSKEELPVMTHLEFTISGHNLIASGADKPQSRDYMARDSGGLPAFLQILLSSFLPPFHKNLKLFDQSQRYPAPSLERMSLL